MQLTAVILSLTLLPNSEKMEAELGKSLYLIYDKTISNMQDILSTYWKKVAQGGRHLLIIVRSRR